jgi:hypothetical protein
VQYSSFDLPSKFSSRLKHMVADLSLDKEALKSVIRKNGWGL